MHLRNGEDVLKIVKRHSTPYLIKIIGIALVALPLYIILFLLGHEFSGEWSLYLFAALSFFLGIILTLISFDYLLDKLVISNKRVVWIDWQSPIRRAEHEAELLDIQDIETREKGILSRVKFFDYGMLEIETASSKTCIIYHDCPDPEGIKHFILAQIEKLHGGIHARRDTPPEEEWSVN